MGKDYYVGMILSHFECPYTEKQLYRMNLDQLKWEYNVLYFNSPWGR